MKIKLLSFVVFLGLFLSCSSGKKKDVEILKLTIGVMSSMDYFPLAVAQQKGYFAEEGLDVTLQKFYAPNDRDAALQSGNLDGTILDYTGGAIQRAGGISLQFTSQCDGTFALMAGKGSGIASVNDLKGKNLAVSRNTVIDFCTDMALEKARLSDADITKSEINKIPLRLEMLRNGKIDATMLPDPFASLAKNGGNTSILTMNELGFHVTGIAFHEKVIHEKSEAIKKFYIAYNKAIEDIQSHPAKDFRNLLIQEIGFSSETVDSVVLPSYTKATLPQESDLSATLSWLKSRKLITSDFDMQSLVAPGLIP